MADAVADVGGSAAPAPVDFESMVSADSAAEAPAAKSEPRSAPKGEPTVSELDAFLDGEASKYLDDGPEDNDPEDIDEDEEAAPVEAKSDEEATEKPASRADKRIQKLVAERKAAE